MSIIAWFFGKVKHYLKFLFSMKSRTYVLYAFLLFSSVYTSIIAWLFAKVKHYLKFLFSMKSMTYVLLLFE